MKSDLHNNHPIHTEKILLAANIREYYSAHFEVTRAGLYTDVDYPPHPLEDRCQPGARDPAFVGLTDLQNPSHKRHRFRIFAHNPEVCGSLV
jgi:hypothetical protein